MIIYIYIYLYIYIYFFFFYLFMYLYHVLSWPLTGHGSIFLEDSYIFVMKFRWIYVIFQSFTRVLYVFMWVYVIFNEFVYVSEWFLGFMYHVLKYFNFFTYFFMYFVINFRNFVGFMSSTWKHSWFQNIFLYFSMFRHFQ